MERSRSRHPGKPLRVFLAGGIAGLLAPIAAAQTVPPEAVDQFKHTIGNRIEAVTVLGGDYGAAGGIYTFRGGTLANVGFTRIGGCGDVSAEKPIGSGDFSWAPVLLGNVGDVWSENTFQDGYLAGNQMRYEVLALEAGGGARVYYGDHISVAATLAGIYGHIENEFQAHNTLGNLVKDAASGTYVDWTAETWSIVPGLTADYVWYWGRNYFDISSRYNFFHTETFSSSSPLISGNGNSDTWENKIDADIPLGLKLGALELHTGGFFSRTDLWGGVEQGLGTGHIYTANGRLVLDCLGHAWVFKWFGFGASYFWSDNMGGWSAGLDLRLQF
ncbi:MAG: hypothetical protein U1F98_03005 [Verrucomicrobiota bacterium]